MPGIEWYNPGADTKDEVGGGFGGRLEIWGLTGWYFDLLVKILPGGHRQ